MKSVTGDEFRTHHSDSVPNHFTSRHSTKLWKMVSPTGFVGRARRDNYEAMTQQLAHYSSVISQQLKEIDQLKKDYAKSLALVGHLKRKNSRDAQSSNELDSDTLKNPSTKKARTEFTVPMPLDALKGLEFHIQDKQLQNTSLLFCGDQVTAIITNSQPQPMQATLFKVHPNEESSKESFTCWEELQCQTLIEANSCVRIGLGTCNLPDTVSQTRVDYLVVLSHLNDPDNSVTLSRSIVVAK